MTNYAIEIENLSKQYSLGQREPYITLRDILSNPFSQKPKKAEFWALQDINLKVKEGEVLGIIGKNGSGKSTLLKILTRITPPTKGRARLQGRVASLLEVGTGFSPELTGRENIFLNGSILGMTRKEIRRKFDEIVDFSGVEKFIDTPVKRYSSGMYVRLAFAVAAHLESEILLVDEVLAVGDMEFQKKCLGKMKDVTQTGKTVLFVSHNMGSINLLCQNALLLNQGKLVLYDKADKVIDAYSNLNQPKKSLMTFTNHPDDNKAKITSVEYLNENNKPIKIIEMKKGFKVKVSFEVTNTIDKGSLEISINKNGVPLIVSSDTDNLETFISRKPGKYISFIHFPQNLLKYGRFSLDIALKHPGVEFFSRRQDIVLDVKNTNQEYELGSINFEPTFTTEKIK